MTKVCRDCGLEKPRTEFYPYNCGDGREPACKVCRLESIERKRVSREFGLSLEDYRNLIAPGGPCTICQSRDRQLVLDHCHETGVLRGVLCNTCNLGLGYFRDNPTLFREAASYLERTKC